MKTYLPFDSRFPAGIHFLFLGLLTGIFLLSACEKEKESNELPVEVPTPPAEEPAQVPDAGSEPAAEPDIVEGIFGEGDGAVIRATGRARKGRDVSLSRQAAANRARGNLLNLLKEKGYSVEPPGILREAVIERYFFKGKFIYAVSSLPLSKVTGALNESEPPPSNTPEDNLQERTERGETR
jgi:hypothetical protein